VVGNNEEEGWRVEWKQKVKWRVNEVTWKWKGIEQKGIDAVIIKEWKNKEFGRENKEARKWDFRDKLKKPNEHIECFKKRNWLNV
jgi:hypothetical protein